MSRDWRIYLDDILTSCKKVQSSKVSDLMKAVEAYLKKK
jgi:uncharacterized protein with HEPN domain